MSQTLKNRATAVFFVLLGLSIGIGSGTLYERHRLQNEALKLELAHYNSRTGEWEWGPIADSIPLAGALPPEIFMEPKKKKR